MAYVLVVDDEKPIRNFLRRRLEGWGFAVEEAQSAAQAVEQMLAEPAEIAIIDIRIPGRDGLSLAEEIHDRWPRTAIIMASGVDDLASTETSRRIGAVAYVPKPFDREILRQALVRAVTAAGN